MQRPDRLFLRLCLRFSHLCRLLLLLSLVLFASRLSACVFVRSPCLVAPVLASIVTSPSSVPKGDSTKSVSEAPPDEQQQHLSHTSPQQQRHQPAAEIAWSASARHVECRCLTRAALTVLRCPNPTSISLTSLALVFRVCLQGGEGGRCVHDRRARQGRHRADRAEESAG